MALVVGIPFVIFWISTAAKAHAPGFFVFFGFVFLVALLVSVGMGFYNATSRNRISQYDITTGGEEGDPFDRLVPPPASGGDTDSATPPRTKAAEAFCPSCGTKLDQGFNFCPKCGKPREQPSDS